MLFEFCAENLVLLEKALQDGASRVELCDNLAVGGTTPSLGVIKAAVQLCERYGASVMTMIRPRGGDFVYTEQEVSIMLDDIEAAIAAGSHGLVFGALTADNHLDQPTMERLIAAAKGQEIVFHMAFDSIPADEQAQSLDWLVEHGVTRILTRAGDTESTLVQRLESYKELLAYAGNRIEILAGGSISLENRDQFIAAGLQQLHGTRVVF